MNDLSKKDLRNLLKISNFLINDEIDQLKNLNKKINLNENGIINSLNKINYNKDFILKINEKYKVISNDLEMVKKLVSIFGNDYDLFSYFINFPNKIDDESFRDFFKKISKKENPLNYLKKVIEELNTQVGGDYIFLDTYDNMNLKNKSTNLNDSSEFDMSNISSENINQYFNFTDTLESDKFSYKDIDTPNC
tara:strand:+ start:235 stop:813 length:579 start_codon:yes stop_codon:yes gene_type:complete